MSNSNNIPTSEEMREHAVGLYDTLSVPLQALQDLAQELRARPDQDTREQKTADEIQTAATHLAQARQALHKATQEWPDKH